MSTLATCRTEGAHALLVVPFDPALGQGSSVGVLGGAVGLVWRGLRHRWRGMIESGGRDYGHGRLLYIWLGAERYHGRPVPGQCTGLMSAYYRHLPPHPEETRRATGYLPLMPRLRLQPARIGREDEIQHN